MPDHVISIRQARQNNLKNLDLELPLGELIVVTGVSGSGKSSLAFDTVYAEGQRRYVETFSPYARQFLDRMDKPQVERIDGIPPAIAIDQTNPVRTSRSTVGTMTELNDHLKLLFARAATLFCRGCATPVRSESPEAIMEALDLPDGARVTIAFEVPVPEQFTQEEVEHYLARQGYTRVTRLAPNRLEVVQARLAFRADRRSRFLEELEAAFERGQGRLSVHITTTGEPRHHHFSHGLHCATCDLSYTSPAPNAFSFNSPMGACDTCRGFGRVIGIDYGLVIPDESLSLADGAVKPWQSKAYRRCQRDLVRFAAERGIPVDVPWRELDEAARRWVVGGEGAKHRKRGASAWYGAAGFFTWLETKAYRMHVRVMLSRYRAYSECTACDGARLKPDALLWRLPPVGDRAAPNMHDIVHLPLSECAAYFEGLRLPSPHHEATGGLLGEIRSRLRYLNTVGLGYLTLDRQSRSLSGGEVQRINLTTALGTSLVNSLFVLDEPSIGLHARDMGRVIDVLKRLRDAGNSLLVVEHDSQVMLAADRVLDMGPGPGRHGGNVVFFGTPRQLLRAQRSLTGDYLRGEKSIALTLPRAQQSTPAGSLSITGARENNLRAVDVDFPVNKLTCLTGVSGSGKSTLMVDILYRGLLKRMGQSTETPGEHDDIIGGEHFERVVLVDQSPIGKTTRATPATYVGAFTAIRNHFAKTPLSLERGYSPGMFSFNSGDGRCPTCGGNGFEHVEMQFLSDVYLRCEDCDGQRFRPELLEIRLDGCSIADVLAMTVSEACGFFASKSDIERALRPLADVGLDYLTLGQPLPTLSGGEAQRLKLAGHLAEHARQTRPKRGKANGATPPQPTLFLFDEPTTGLHFDDIATLLEAFGLLLGAGHTLLVIEHNLDVINAADWIVDLGPEGGDAGGGLVATGTPADIACLSQSHTGAALASHRARLGEPASVPRRQKRSATHDAIEVVRAREHNLSGFDVAIPKDRLTVVTGISGSGKSTLAFDIVFAEGQRRYLESLNAYARQFVQPATRPEVDAVLGIPPTVAIEQRTSRGGWKSTVATMTELYHFIRLLFVKLGQQHCPTCDVPVHAQTVHSIVARVYREYVGKDVVVLSPLVSARKGYYTELARWAHAKGYDRLKVDGAWTPTDPWPRLKRFVEHDIELPVGTVRVDPKYERELVGLIETALETSDGVVQIWAENGGSAPSLYSVRHACPRCERSFPPLDPRLLSFNSRHGWCPQCTGTGRADDPDADADTGRAASVPPCPGCEGHRLSETARAVRLGRHSVTDIVALTVTEARDFFRDLTLDARGAALASDVLSELRARLHFLEEVGLGYMPLLRAAPSLSGGEAQRIRLAAQLGSNLRGVCYILDEPTIGLHPRDNVKLLDTLARLRDKGNTVVVVEHDEDTIRCADHIVDLGPRAGREGGEIVAAGPLDDVLSAKRSLTGLMLREPPAHPYAAAPRPAKPTKILEVRSAVLHNLRGIDVEFPLERVVCVTGVSGSGKSTLVRDVLQRNLAADLASRKRKGRAVLSGCAELVGATAVDRVLEVDQSPIGKTPRSCPATYVGLWDYVRKLYAETTEARIRGFAPSRFSFNVAGGRCDTCSGQGLEKIEMSFLPDVRVKCEECDGARFNEETLAVRYRGQTIADVLALSVDEAVAFFDAHPVIHHALTLLQDVGLGYLTLGQQSPTLSGGEAQRIKLVTELAKAGPAIPAAQATPQPGRRRPQPRTLYLLDEPTIGLHMADVERLVRVLHRLAHAGNSVIVVEHNLDVIAEADWMIDLGPEGGGEGGRVVAEGNPIRLAKRKRKTHTTQALFEHLGRHAT